MTQFIKDTIKYIGSALALIAGVFLMGFFIGRGKQRIVDLHDVEPDRVYIQSFPVAGEEEYEHILVKEYAIDFIEKW